MNEELGYEASETMDRYTESIEISNKCREFYHKRLEMAENTKQRLSPTNPSRRGGRNTSIDVAMKKLGEEMSSLMDQDLSLMKQLLILNETIEELKWKRRCSYESMPDSSAELDVSNWSVSDNEMFDSNEDVSRVCETEEDVKSLSEALKHTCAIEDNDFIKRLDKQPKVSQIKIENAIYKQTSQEDQRSCDSGICDAFVPENLP